MKIQRILCLAAAIVIPQLVLAKMPFTNDIFGKVEGTLDYCARVDPPGAGKYRERKKVLVKDVPESEVAEARETEEYKTSYEWIGKELPKLPKDQVLKACAAALEDKN
ncbi:MAG: hypothetical protein WA628_23790 [Terriglobales bacterium]